MVIYVSVRTFLTGKIQFFCLKNLYWFFIIIIISSSSRHPTCATGAIEPSWSLHLSYIHISFFFLNWVYTVNFTECDHILRISTLWFSDSVSTLWNWWRCQAQIIRSNSTLLILFDLMIRAWQLDVIRPFVIIICNCMYGVCRYCRRRSFLQINFANVHWIKCN